VFPPGLFPSPQRCSGAMDAVMHTMSAFRAMRDGKMSEYIPDTESVAVSSFNNRPSRFSAEHGHCTKLAGSRACSVFMKVVIVLNIALLGVSTEVQHPQWKSAYKVFEYAASTLYFVEMVVLVATQRCKYFKSILNAADFIVAWLSLVDIVITAVLGANNMSIIQLLKFTRLLRIAKLLKVFPALKVLIMSMLDSLKALLWLLIFMCILLYVVAVFCVFVTGHQDAGYPGYNADEATLKAVELQGFNNYKHFGTLWRAVLTLFHLILMSELPDVLRPTSAVQPWMTCLLGCFVLIMSLCVLNTIIGVVVNSTVSVVLHDDSRLQDERRKQMSAIEDLASVMFHLDVDGNQEISREELRAGATNPLLQQILRQIDLPAGFTIDELFLVLDTNGNGQITRNEFIGGMFRLIYSNDFQRQCISRLSEASMRQYIGSIRQEIFDRIREENGLLLKEIRRLVCPALLSSPALDLMPHQKDMPVALEQTMSSSRQSDCMYHRRDMSMNLVETTMSSSQQSTPRKVDSEIRTSDFEPAEANSNLHHKMTEAPPECCPHVPMTKRVAMFPCSLPGVPPFRKVQSALKVDDECPPACEGHVESAEACAAYLECSQACEENVDSAQAWECPQVCEEHVEITLMDQHAEPSSGMHAPSIPCKPSSSLLTAEDIQRLKVFNL